MVPDNTGAQTPDGTTVHVVGSVQGLVIGDHNTVNQNFCIRCWLTTRVRWRSA